MKKIVLTTLMIGIYLGTYAQGNPVTSAFRYMQNEEFDKAVEQIELGVNNEKLKTKSKTWHYRGLIYTKVAILKTEMQYQFTYPEQEEQSRKYAKSVENPIELAIASFKQVQALGDDSRNSEIDNNVMTLATLAMNDGVAYWSKGFDEMGAIANPESFKKSYHSYNTFMNAYNMLGNTAKVLFDNNLKENKIEITNIKIAMASASYYGKMDVELTKKLYRELIDKNVNDYLIYRNLSAIYEEAGDIESAKKLWSEGRSKHPDNKDIALDEAIFYQRIGEEKELLSKLESAINLDPNNSSLYNVLGGIYTKMVVESNNSKSENKKENLLSDELKNQYMKKAIELLDKAIALDDQEVTNFTQKGSLFLSEALVYYNQAQSLGYSAADNKKSADLAVLYKKDFNLALKEYLKAYEINPNSLIALDYLSKIYLWLENTAESVKYKKLFEEAKAAN